MTQTEDFPWSVAYMAYEHRPIQGPERNKWFSELSHLCARVAYPLGLAQETFLQDEAKAYRELTEHLYSLRGLPPLKDRLEAALRGSLHIYWLQWSQLRPGLRKYQAYRLARYLRSEGLNLGILPDKWREDQYVSPLLLEGSWGVLRNLLIQMTSEGVQVDTMEKYWQEKALELLERCRTHKPRNPRGGRPKGENHGG